MPDNIGARELLLRSTQHDPALLKPFDGYVLRVVAEDQQAVLLVGSEDGSRALLEDAACTAGLDRHAWREAGAACAFSLVVATACGQGF